MELEAILNQATQNKYNFSIKSAVLESSTGVCHVELFYSDGTLLTNQVKQICQTEVEKFLPQGYTYKLSFIKNFVSSDGVLTFLNDYLKSNFASLEYKIENIDIDKLKIEILFEKIQESYIKDKRVVQTIELSLKKQFDTDFLIASKFDELVDYNKVGEDEQSIKLSSTKYIKVSDIQLLYGEKDIQQDATYIRDSKQLGKTVCLCGYVRNFRKNWTKPRAKNGQNKEELEEYFSKEVPLFERKAAGQKARYKFLIEDFTESISTMVVASIDDCQPLDKLSDGSTIIAVGEIVEDKFNNEMVFKPTQIGFCTLPEKWEEEIDYKTEKSYYEFVAPQPMEYTDQVGFFSMEEERYVAPYLKNHDVVVFDLETTGLNVYAGDKMIEIGAVKLVNGAIVEKFQSYIDPEMKIGAEAMKIHHITQDMVAGKPKAKQVLQDFYKFTRGCVLTGYNVNFDLGFLIKQGKESRYNFDNPTFDIYHDLSLKHIKGLKNYKLGTVAKHLGVSLDNAHSALDDTIATAEVLIKLANYLTNED